MWNAKVNTLDCPGKLCWIRWGFGLKRSVFRHLRSTGGYLDSSKSWDAQSFFGKSSIPRFQKIAFGYKCSKTLSNASKIQRNRQNYKIKCQDTFLRSCYSFHLIYFNNGRLHNSFHIYAVVQMHFLALAVLMVGVLN